MCHIQIWPQKWKYGHITHRVTNLWDLHCHCASPWQQNAWNLLLLNQKVHAHLNDAAWVDRAHYNFYQQFNLILYSSLNTGWAFEKPGGSCGEWCICPASSGAPAVATPKRPNHSGPSQAIQSYGSQARSSPDIPKWLSLYPVGQGSCQRPPWGREHWLPYLCIIQASLMGLQSYLARAEPRRPTSASVAQDSQDMANSLCWHPCPPFCA